MHERHRIFSLLVEAIFNPGQVFVYPKLYNNKHVFSVALYNSTGKEYSATPITTLSAQLYTVASTACMWTTGRWTVGLWRHKIGIQLRAIRR